MEALWVVLRDGSAFPEPDRSGQRMVGNPGLVRIYAGREIGLGIAWHFRTWKSFQNTPEAFSFLTGSL